MASDDSVKTSTRADGRLRDRATPFSGVPFPIPTTTRWNVNPPPKHWQSQRHSVYYLSPVPPCRGSFQSLPVSAQGVPTYAQGLRLRGVEWRLAIDVASHVAFPLQVRGRHAEGLISEPRRQQGTKGFVAGFETLASLLGNGRRGAGLVGRRLAFNNWTYPLFSSQFASKAGANR